MQLCAQSIQRLCEYPTEFPDGISRPLIFPFMPRKVVVNGASWGLSACSYDVRVASDLWLAPGDFALANTLENFAIPHNVAAFVCDKSTYARRGISAFNTLFDPGFIGNATLELVNHSRNEVAIKAGDPICQIVFHWLDAATDRPYSGKYQFQPQRPVAAILEGVGGTT